MDSDRKFQFLRPRKIDAPIKNGNAECVELAKF